MAHDTAATLKRTPFHDIHTALGAKMVPFAGYEMPVQYPTGIIAEHRAVREQCGLFDVSHMGEFIVRGPGAMEFVNFVTTNDAGALAVGQAHYSMLLNDRGTIEDDCLVYRLPDRIMIVVNASNREKDFAHIGRHAARFDCTLEDVSDEIALLALQGPLCVEVLRSLTTTDVASIPYYHFAIGDVAGVSDVIISRTGYTGEDGFELYFPAAQGERVWNALMQAGSVTPAGLGARDSLRLEAGMALYGNDIDDTTTPLDGRLGWTVKMDKGDFVGRAALAAQKARGVERRLTGFTTRERVIPRPGYPVFVDGERTGEVRSGAMSPTLGLAIGTCYLPVEQSREGQSIALEIRGKRVPCIVAKMPFYKRPNRG